MTIDPVAYARRWKTLAVLSLSLLIIGLDNTILNVALPSLLAAAFLVWRRLPGAEREPAAAHGTTAVAEANA